MYGQGNFDAVKEYILKHIFLDEKAVSMNVLQEIYGVGMRDKRYRGSQRNA